ncbi:hypothetical protein OF83DRAFT_1118624 [Amylostereum chailletii]|nr:hypothetical protein OF83DRAFT_1118624 [Amylostereum chailletii]
MSLPREDYNISSNNPSQQDDFFYSVLNLPRSASDNEIRERYRNLSVIFHPDKQRDENTKTTASKRFLEIQKAYEVLSDPFRRTVYDVLGYGGLKREWPPEWRNKSGEELKDLLLFRRRDLDQQELEDIIRPQGRVSIGIDGRTLVRRSQAVGFYTWVDELRERVSGVRTHSFSVRHRFQTNITPRTKVILASRVSRGKPGAQGSGVFIGTIRHQYSPRLNFEATASIFHPTVVSLRASHGTNEFTFTAQTVVPLVPVLMRPPLTLSYTRSLFKDSFTQGVITVSTEPRPSLDLSVISPTPFNLTPESRSRRQSGGSALGSVSGLGVGAIHWSCGMALAGRATGLRAEWGITFSEIETQAKLGLIFGLDGLSWLLTGAWGNGNTGVTASVFLSSMVVELKFDMAYLGQRLVIPVTLADHYDPSLAVLAATMPAAVFGLVYNLVLKPRRRRQRIDFYRAARKEFAEEKSSVRREFEDTISLLKDAARKHTQAEKAVGGLVVLEATYGPTDPDPEAKELIVDVTVPVQALVHKSQLYIPGHRPKVCFTL